MPAEITQSNAHAAEVRFVCDECGEMIGTQLMLREKAEAQIGKRVICRRCRENKNNQARPNPKT
ncbi:MAG: hypothetical protein ACE14S_11725 [Candidatus Bathyarchaeia archaeon]